MKWRKCRAVVRMARRWVPPRVAIGAALVLVILLAVLDMMR